MSRTTESPRVRQDLPSGQITFLFTDLEGSSAAWERRPESARTALRYHDRVANDFVDRHDGIVINHTGDGIKAVFTSSSKALSAAYEMQRHFQEDLWDGVERMRVRIGLHSGVSTPDGDDYYGSVINRAACVADIANGDQIAVTEAIVNSNTHVRDSGFRFEDCGQIQLKGCGRERIFLVVADDLIADDRPLRSRQVLAGSGLPPEGGRLIGRQAEIQRVVGFLADRRLVSIIGLGGMGKTRLAIAAARDHADRFADGVVYCPLGSIAAGGIDPDASVLAALAEALGARRQPDQDLLSSIVNFVTERDVLIVFDNCEHVKSAIAPVIERVLAIDGPTILVTSREPMGLVGEQRVNLEPLAVDSDAVELLTERAFERDPGFDANEHNEALLAIARYLDGIPLALELAAARLRLLTPARLLEGLQGGLAVLGVDATLKRSGLQGVLAWSFEQLNEGQQSVLEGLSVFVGGFTLEAAAVVLSVDDEITLLDDLAQLIDLSLVKTQPGQGEMTFSVLETIRQFGVSQLEQRSPDLLAQRQSAHANFYAALAARCGRDLMTVREAEVWARIDVSSSNIRVGFDHLVRAGELDAAAAIVVDLAWFSTFAMRMEFFGWARELLEIPALAESAELWAVRSIGQYLSANEGCVQSAKRSLELDPLDPTGLANTTLASVGLNNTFDASMVDVSTEEMLKHPNDRFREKTIAGLGLRSFSLCLRAPSKEAVRMAEHALAEASKTGSASALTVGYWAQAVANLIINWSTTDEAVRSGLAMAESLSRNHLMSHLINGLTVHFSALTGPVEEAAEIAAREIRATMGRHYLVGASHLLGAASVILCRAGRVNDGAALLGAMMSQGHRPRREVREAVEAAIVGDTDAFTAGHGWSINQAGAQATEWLDELAGSGGAEAP